MGEGESSCFRAVRGVACGRVEIAGNHVDHQGGIILASTVDDKLEAVVTRTGRCENGAPVARLFSEGFPKSIISLSDLAPRADERGTNAAFLRGTVAELARAGIVVDEGFDVNVASNLPVGGGFSSSAALELALAQALAASFGGVIDSPRELAAIGMRVERQYFGKPCGLMDQTAIAQGGIVAVDFSNMEQPAIRHISFDFERAGYALYLIDAFCDHSLFAEDFALVAQDMAAAAEFLHVPVLRALSRDRFWAAFPEIRRALGDRVALRACHFFNEIDLVEQRIAALEAYDIDRFLKATRLSSISSTHYLQNVSRGQDDFQPAMVALALAELLLQGRGAARIHGGGFGGSVQAFVPLSCEREFVEGMQHRFAPDCCRRMRLSDQPAKAVIC